MRLRDLRAEKGWTLAQLAEILGVRTPEVVRRYEIGERVPRPRIIEKIEALSDGRVTFEDHFAAHKLRLREQSGVKVRPARPVSERAA